MTKVIYVPLDERNCNLKMPVRIGAAAGLEVLTPSEEIVGQYKMQSDADAVWEWLLKNAKECQYAVLSLDMLVYGGLLRSRRHHSDTKECYKRLDRIRQLREENPQLKIFVFMLIMRTSNSNSSSEEPEYWEKYGKNIWSTGYLSDKKSRTGLDEAEENELKSLEGVIPAEFINDYTGRRKVNLAVNLRALDMLSCGLFDELVIPKDDNSEFGYSTKDNETILTEVMRLGIGNKVMIYPGADEVGSTLIARIINRISKTKPHVFVCYSSTFGSQIIAKYEDRPINESIKCQILSAGCIPVDTSEEADIVLMVNTPGIKMLECHEQTAFDHGYSNFRNLREFVERIKYYTQKGKHCAVADIAYCNGSDNELVGLLMSENLIDKIVAYGGWNTAANTLGVVISQAVAAHYSGNVSIRDNDRLFNILIYKVVEDWAYQANVMIDVVSGIMASGVADCYALGVSADSVADEICTKLNDFTGRHFSDVGKVSVSAFRLPWGRTFDIDFDLSIE